METTTMQAALFERAGEAQQVVQLRSIPIPEPGPGEVLVRLQAASLHPADHMFIAGAYRSKPVFPQRAGLVGAGVIVRSGATVDLREGTRVAFRHPGAWAEYAVVPAARLFVVPEGAAAEAAGQFALNPITAWGLLETAGVSAGDWLAVNAAASNVALMVRGLAQARGVRVLEVPRFEEGDVEFARRLLAATGGTPIAALLDAVGGPALAAVLPALRQGATLVSYGLLDPGPVPVRNADLIYRNLTWTGFGIDHWLAQHAAERDAITRALWDAIASGALPLPVRARYPLAELVAALRTDAAGGAGKVLLTFGDGA
jgi:NADPH:quinone reductase-like Zn-dependent oxidoreductase